MSLAQGYAVAEVLLLAGAVGSLVVLVLFLFASGGSWRHSLTGAAILVSLLAVAMLLNLEIVLALIGASEYVDVVVTVIILAVIDAGLAFKFGAIWVEWRRSRRRKP